MELRNVGAFGTSSFPLMVTKLELEAIYRQQKLLHRLQVCLVTQFTSYVSSYVSEAKGSFCSPYSMSGSMTLKLRRMQNVTTHTPRTRQTKMAKSPRQTAIRRNQTRNIRSCAGSTPLKKQPYYAACSTNRPAKEISNRTMDGNILQQPKPPVLYRSMKLINLPLTTGFLEPLI